MIDWLTKMAERHGSEAGWTVAILAAAVALWQWADKHLREHYRDTIDDRNDAIDQRDGLNKTLREEVDRLASELDKLRAELDDVKGDLGHERRLRKQAEADLAEAEIAHAHTEALQDVEIRELRAEVKSLREDLMTITPPTVSDAWEE